MYESALAMLTDVLRP
jgi:ubiquitin-conjugating enzyme E2 M